MFEMAFSTEKFQTVIEVCCTRNSFNADDSCWQRLYLALKSWNRPAIDDAAQEILDNATYHDKRAAYYGQKGDFMVDDIELTLVSRSGVTIIIQCIGGVFHVYIWLCRDDAPAALQMLAKMAVTEPTIRVAPFYDSTRDAYGLLSTEAKAVPLAGIIQAIGYQMAKNNVTEDRQTIIHRRY